jgi:hypothetical protein
MRGEVRGDPLLTFNAASHARIIAVMAGGEAIATLLGPGPRGDENDIAEIEVMIEDMELNDPERIKSRLRAMTRMLILRHEAPIERVAGALLDKETLSATQLDKLVGRGVAHVEFAAVGNSCPRQALTKMALN